MVERRQKYAWRQNLRILLMGLGTIALGCEGTGSEQPGRIVQQASDPRCAPVGGPYPSGLDLLPDEPSTGALMQFSPKALLAFDLKTSPPTLLNQTASPPFPSDSDGDGRADLDAFRDAGLCPSFNPACIADPKPGGIRAVRDDLALLTTSDYEQVMFLRPATGEPVPLSIRNPHDEGDHRAADWPLLPDPGITASRTALSTQTCIYPDPALDSRGGTVAADPTCEWGGPSFRTRFTAATAKSDGLLFVATSNLASSAESRFNPGSVLIYHFDPGPGGAPISPHVERRFLQTSDFNPTALMGYSTANGRNLILITNTGAISTGGEILDDSSVDVLDVESLQIVARYPLGRAGARGPVRIDPSGRVGLLGAESQRTFYAIDLGALDDPALYDRNGLPPIDLDGRSPNFPDARIFWADRPITWSRRPDGPSEDLCPTRTTVDFSVSGRHAYATDWCDGSLTVIAVDLTSEATGTLPPDRFRVIDRLDWFAPKTPDLYGLPTALSQIRSFESDPQGEGSESNIVFILNEPEGQLCTARLEY